MTEIQYTCSRLSPEAYDYLEGFDALPDKQSRPEASGFLRSGVYDTQGRLDSYLHIDTEKLDPDHPRFDATYNQAYRQFSDAYLNYVATHQVDLKDECASFVNEAKDSLYAHTYVDNTKAFLPRPSDETLGAADVMKFLSFNVYLFQIDFSDIIKAHQNSITGGYEWNWWNNLQAKPFYKQDQTPARAAKLGYWLDRQNFDIAALQEVWQQKWMQVAMDRSGFDKWYYFSDLKQGTNDLGLASRTSMSHPHFDAINWNAASWTECGKDLGFGHRFGLASAVVRFNGRDVLVFNVHSFHREARFEEHYRLPVSEFTADRMIQWIEMWVAYQKRRAAVEKEYGKKLPVIFTGDPNFNHHHQEAHFFEQLFGLKDSCEFVKADACTFCEDAINTKNNYAAQGVLDHTYYDDSMIEMLYAEIVNPEDKGLVLSDHRPVVSYMKLKDESEVADLNPTPEALPPIPLDDVLLRGLIDYLQGYTEYWDDTAYNFACHVPFLSSLGTERAERTMNLIRSLLHEPESTAQKYDPDSGFFEEYERDAGTSDDDFEDFDEAFDEESDILPESVPFSLDPILPQQNPNFPYDRPAPYAGEPEPFVPLIETAQTFINATPSKS